MFSDGSSFTYNELFHQMTDDEVEEANAALDLVIEQQKKQMNKSKKK